MLDSTFALELSTTLPQREIWDFEERLQTIEGVETDLHETRGDIATAVQLFIQFAPGVIHQAASIGGDVKTIAEVAVMLYGFVHVTHSAKNPAQKRDLTIKTKKGKQIKISDLSVDEIKQVLRDIL